MKTSEKKKNIESRKGRHAGTHARRAKTAVLALPRRHILFPAAATAGNTAPYSSPAGIAHVCCCRQYSHTHLQYACLPYKPIAPYKPAESPANQCPPCGVERLQAMIQHAVNCMPQLASLNPHSIKAHTTGAFSPCCMRFYPCSRRLLPMQCATAK